MLDDRLHCVSTKLRQRAGFCLYVQRFKCKSTRVRRANCRSIKILGSFFESVLIGNGIGFQPKARHADFPGGVSPSVEAPIAGDDDYRGILTRIMV